MKFPNQRKILECASAAYGGNNDALGFLGIILTAYGLGFGFAATSLCAGIGFSPQSKTFINTMNQRVLLKNGNTYYYGYPGMSEALRIQGAYKAVDTQEPGAQKAIPTQRA